MNDNGREGASFQGVHLLATRKEHVPSVSLPIVREALAKLEISNDNMSSEAVKRARNFLNKSRVFLEAFESTDTENDSLAQLWQSLLGDYILLEQTAASDRRFVNAITEIKQRLEHIVREEYPAGLRVNAPSE